MQPIDFTFAVANPRRYASAAHEVQVLRDRVAELEEMLGISDEPPYVALGFGKIEGNCLGVLMKRKSASRDMLYAAVWGARLECEQPEIRIVDVYVCRIRKKLMDMGVALQTNFGHGWFIRAADKDLVRLALERAYA